MSVNTSVKDFAAELKVPVDTLLDQLTLAGVPKKSGLDIISEEDKFWKFISKKRLLDNQRISLDKRLLESFYKNRGYYNVKIVSDTVQYQENRDAHSKNRPHRSAARYACQKSSPPRPYHTA